LRQAGLIGGKREGAGVDVNQETKKAQEKPVLSAESFHSLLAAAYLLQVEKDRTVLQPMEAGHTYPFTAGAIVQKRTPSLLVGQPSLLASRSALPFTSPGDSDNSAGRIYPPHVSAAPLPHATKIFASRAMFFRAVEALAIATIFFAVIGVSIRHPLLANPDGRSMLAEMPEQQGSSLPRIPPRIPPTIPIAKILASGQQVPVMPSSRQLPHGAEADTVAEDAVVHYLKQALNLPGQAAKKPAMLAAETVVQYGQDVTVWSGNLTKRDGRDRLRR
jgi:hypothetical protein